MAIKPFHFYTRRAEAILEAYDLNSVSSEEVIAVFKARHALRRYMASREIGEAEYCEAFTTVMESLDNLDFADRKVAKTVRTLLRMADIVHLSDGNKTLQYLLFGEN